MTLQAAQMPVASVESFTTCVHCGSDLPSRSTDPFCCSGCRHVYRLLQESGLSRYYDLRGGRRLAPATLPTTRANEPWLEQLLGQLEGEAGGAERVRRFSLDVQGLQCGACVWLIEAVFKRAKGGLSIRTNPALGQLSCVVERGFSLPDFVHAVEDFGYRLGPARKQAAPAQRGLLLRTGVCLALAANTMFLSATTYFGLEEGALYDLVQNASFALATLSTLVGGSYFVGRALTGLKRGVFHLDLPIAVGMLLAYAGSVWSLWIGRGQASYLDTVSVFIALMLVGRVLQERLIERNRRQLLASEGASALLARVVRAGHAELVPCAQVRPGDQLLVCPGELVVVRATLMDPAASCSLDWINGESEPRRFNQGDELVPGSINAGQSPLHATACASFESSDLDLLLRDGSERDVRQRGDFWDALARVYVLIVLLATAGGVALWWWSGYSAERILELATATLVVTCPCAFGIATPLAYELGVARLRQLGLFVRDGTFFDRAARVRQIVFDKTGTLTTGSLVLKAPAVLGTLRAYERGVLYSMASQSGHPKSVAIARAVRALDDQAKLLVEAGGSAREQNPLEVLEVPGVGLECHVEGVRYRLGSPAWAAPAQAVEVGPVFCADERVLCLLETEEVARPDAQHEVKALREEGYQLWIASGDKPEHVHELARTLQIDGAHAHGGLTPSGKVALLASVDRGDTLMLGDGINDGPALSRALCSGTPAIDRPFVPARTDFYYLTPGLSPVRSALRVARKVRKTVRGALVFATAYNVLVVGLAYAGWMVPWLAAVLMPASSLFVLVFTGLSLSPRRILWKS